MSYLDTKCQNMLQKSESCQTCLARWESELNCNILQFVDIIEGGR